VRNCNFRLTQPFDRLRDVVGGGDVATGLTHVLTVNKPPPTNIPKKKTPAIIKPF
jgi:hypothetical protein